MSVCPSVGDVSCDHLVQGVSAAWGEGGVCLGHLAPLMRMFYKDGAM